jgi:hypothetical protein
VATSGHLPIDEDREQYAVVAAYDVVGRNPEHRPLALVLSVLAVVESGTWRGRGSCCERTGIWTFATGPFPAS